MISSIDDACNGEFLHFCVLNKLLFPSLLVSRGRGVNSGKQQRNNEATKRDRKILRRIITNSQNMIKLNYANFFQILSILYFGFYILSTAAILAFQLKKKKDFYSKFVKLDCLKELQFWPSN
jgi:hypothetical protein